MRSAALVLFVLLAPAACGESRSSLSGGDDGGAPDGSVASTDSGAIDDGGSIDGALDGGAGAKTLGMNDVTVLVPLSTSTVLLKATDTGRASPSRRRCA